MGLRKASEALICAGLGERPALSKTLSKKDTWGVTSSGLVIAEGNGEGRFPQASVELILD